MMLETKSDMVVTRTFDAPNELVFEAWTNPECLVPGRNGAKRFWSEEFERLAEDITKG